ncbi:hypothetical protein BHM03_00000054 [Ensete ventricosum]|uniref:Uncharacterized protein n=1 Tax=Ensete ventricosum TaxID=4639 RepID=A0A445M896_ENSVE|nr:hypothetical protein BHM03_00000054 [Ensete ventricosum]
MKQTLAAPYFGMSSPEVRVQRTVSCCRRRHTGAGGWKSLQYLLARDTGEGSWSRSPPPFQLHHHAYTVSTTDLSVVCAYQSSCSSSENQKSSMLVRNVVEWANLDRGASSWGSSDRDLVFPPVAGIDHAFGARRAPPSPRSHEPIGSLVQRRFLLPSP